MHDAERIGIVDVDVDLIEKWLEDPSSAASHWTGYVGEVMDGPGPLRILAVLPLRRHGVASLLVTGPKLQLVAHGWEYPVIGRLTRAA